jgi:MmgE/PrpD N-terminal domain
VAGGLIAPEWNAGWEARDARAACRLNGSNFTFLSLGHNARIAPLLWNHPEKKMAQQIEELARFVAETTLEEVPKEVQWHAKLVVLDTIGVILAGASRPEVRGLRERLNPTAGAGATVFAPGWPTNDPRNAAFLNGSPGDPWSWVKGTGMFPIRAQCKFFRAY